MIGLVAVIKAKPGFEKEVARAARKMADNVKEKEKECLLYDPFTAEDDPTKIYILEKYTSRGALDEHRKFAHYQEFRETIKDAVEGPPEVTLLDFIG